MVQDGDGGAGGGSKVNKLVYTRFLVLTGGGPFQPSNMPSMNIKTAEGCMDESNCFYTFFTTAVVKRVPQISIAIDRYNRTTAKKISLAVNAEGSDYVVIFPGKTNYRDNKTYKKIAMAKTSNNSTYWTWQAHVGMSEVEEEQMMVQFDDKQVCEELEDELVMVKAENKEAREKLEAELAKVKDGNKRVRDELAMVRDGNKKARDELAAELAKVQGELAVANEENQRLRGELEESQNLHGGLKQMRFCCG
jgi:hypothetical protein